MRSCALSHAERHAGLVFEPATEIFPVHLVGRETRQTELLFFSARPVCDNRLSVGERKSGERIVRGVERNNPVVDQNPERREVNIERARFVAVEFGDVQQVIFAYHFRAQPVQPVEIQRPPECGDQEEVDKNNQRNVRAKKTHAFVAGKAGVGEQSGRDRDDRGACAKNFDAECDSLHPESSCSGGVPWHAGGVVSCL